MKACILKQNEKLPALAKQMKRRDSTGKSALMYASEVANIEAMKMLLTQEARMQDKIGMTALMLACKSGSVEAVELLYDMEYNLRNQV